MGTPIRYLSAFGPGKYPRPTFRITRRQPSAEACRLIEFDGSKLHSEADSPPRTPPSSDVCACSGDNLAATETVLMKLCPGR